MSRSIQTVTLIAAIILAGVFAFLYTRTNAKLEAATKWIENNVQQTSDMQVRENDTDSSGDDVITSGSGTSSEISSGVIASETDAAEAAHEFVRNILSAPSDNNLQFAYIADMMTDDAIRDYYAMADPSVEIDDEKLSAIRSLEHIDLPNSQVTDISVIKCNNGNGTYTYGGMFSTGNGTQVIRSIYVALKISMVGDKYLVSSIDNLTILSDNTAPVVDRSVPPVEDTPQAEEQVLAEGDMPAEQ